MTRGFSFLKQHRGAHLVILFIAVLPWLPVNQAGAQEVGEAMQAFIRAMESKNPTAILSAFSSQSPWKYQPYEIGTRRRLRSETVTPAKLASDFQQKTGWYDFFLAEPNGYTFRLNFMDGRLWKKRRAQTFVAPESSSGDTYITWRREGGTWVIGEIGETTP
jgi:hypothetical protein